MNDTLTKPRALLRWCPSCGTAPDVWCSFEAGAAAEREWTATQLRGLADTPPGKEYYAGWMGAVDELSARVSRRSTTPPTQGDRDE